MRDPHIGDMVLFHFRCYPTVGDHIHSVMRARPAVVTAVGGRQQTELHVFFHSTDRTYWPVYQSDGEMEYAGRHPERQAVDPQDALLAERAVRGILETDPAHTWTFRSGEN